MGVVQRREGDYLHVTSCIIMYYVMCTNAAELISAEYFFVSAMVSFCTFVTIFSVFIRYFPNIVVVRLGSVRKLHLSTDSCICIVAMMDPVPSQFKYTYNT